MSCRHAIAAGTFAVLMVQSTPVKAQVDHWGLSSTDWLSLPGITLRDKLNVKARRIEIEEKARKGDLKAMTIAAGALQTYVWGAPDYPASYAYAKLAAEGGVPRAMMILGTLLANGLGVTADPEQALAWFHKSVDLGQIQSITGIGMVLEAGSGIAKDEAGALSWYRRAADLGEPHAMYLIARALWNGIGVPKDAAKAFVAMRRAAEAGSPDGMLWYGLWLGDASRSADADIEKSTAWVGRAAAAGSRDAMYVYGQRLRAGLGIAANVGESAILFERGIREGDERAKFQLAYLIGSPNRGVPLDRTRALRLYREVGRSRNDDIRRDFGGNANFNIGAMLQQDGDFGGARFAYRQAKDAGYAGADQALVNLDTWQRDEAARAQQQAAYAQQQAAAAVEARAQASTIAKAKMAADRPDGAPSAASILRVSDRANAQFYGVKTTDVPGMLISYSALGVELFRTQRSIDNLSCQKIANSSYRCSYDMTTQLGYAEDNSWSGLLGALSVGIRNAFNMGTVANRWAYIFTKTATGWQSPQLRSEIQAAAAAARSRQIASADSRDRGDSNLDRQLKLEKSLNDAARDWYSVGR